MRAVNAVELTVDAAWYCADATGAGALPWVLGITTPYRDAGQRAGFREQQVRALTDLGIITGAGVSASVAQWLRVVCFPQQWLELRYVRGDSGELLRGIVARRDGRTVVALRNAQLVTFTELTVDHPDALVPILGAGLGHRAAARFPEFVLPARVGARADAQLRAGAELAGVLNHLGVPAAAHHVVEAVFSGPRRYVEVVAGQRRDGTHTTSEVGIALVDTAHGRLLVSPTRAADGEWISCFAPATPFAVAMAIERLTATLPDGPWFPAAHLARDFTARRA